MAGQANLNVTNVDDAILNGVAKKMAGPLGTLEGHLQALAGTQTDLNAALKGQTGTAVQHAFGNAYETGKKVGVFLQEIMDTIIAGSSSFSEADLDAVQRLGVDGTGDFGSATGDWNNNSVEAVGERDMSKVKLDF